MTAPATSRMSVFVARLVAGAIAGFAVGVVDAAASWSPVARYIAGGAARAGFVLYVGALYALAGMAVLPLVALIARHVVSRTRLGDVARFAASHLDERRRRDPLGALPFLALVLGGFPAMGLTLAATFALARSLLGTRNHMDLLVAESMLMAIAGLVLGALVAFVVARPIEVGLAALARRPAGARALSSPRLPWIAFGVFTAAAAAIAVKLSWSTLEQVELRAPLVCAGGVALGVLSRRVTRRATDRFAAAPVVAMAIVAADVAVVFLGAGDDRIRKSAWPYTGMAGPIIEALRSLGDRDGDGYAAILGGGDCDDANPAVHPGAVDVPGDGIDQNCTGKDAVTRPPSPPVRISAAIPPPAAAKANILLITIDALRADHVGAYGHGRPTTPAIDALANDAATFTRAWTHAPMTKYAMPTIHTGLYPLDVPYDASYRYGWRAVTPKATTLAEVLKGRGFATAAVLNYSYFNEERGLAQGFDRYDNRNKALHGGDGPFEPRGSSAKEQTDGALRFLDGRPAEGRFFLWVHYMEPHFGYERHAGTSDFGSAPIDLYDGEIRFADEHVGRLIAGLKERGLYDSTAIVLTGDHGEAFGEHGVIFHGSRLDGAQTKVPLIVRIPGAAPRRVSVPAGHVDLLPTLADISGAELRDAVPGESLVPAIAGDDDTRDRAIFQQLSAPGIEVRAAVTRRCHLVYQEAPIHAWELYRIDDDPHELRDAIDDPGPCGGLRAELEAWLDRSL